MSRPKAFTECSPPIEGATPYERFENVLKRVISVSKTEVDRRVTKEQRHKKKRKA